VDLPVVRARLDALTAQARNSTSSNASVESLHQGTLSLMRTLYGPDSSNERQLAASIALHKHTRPDLVSITSVLGGTLENMSAEIAAGFVGSLQARIAGEVLADLIALAKEVLLESNTDAKNVACVLAAAAFEDTLRRLAALRGIPHLEKLADVVTALKESAVLQGAQVGLAQSYLNFRNRALHAKWSEVDRPEAQSILAFTEGLVTKHLA
jgi:hypothetical protein